MTDQKKQNPPRELHDDKAMPDPQDKGRRTALRKLVIGAGALTAYHVLPVRWSQPIVEQIVLPAHAGTSGVSLFDPCTVKIISGDTTTATVTVSVDGYVTPPTANLPAQIVATPSGGGGGPVTVNTTTDAAGKFGATVTVGGGPGITKVSVVTTVTGAVNTASCAALVPKPGAKPTQGPGTTPWGTLPWTPEPTVPPTTTGTQP